MFSGIDSINEKARNIMGKAVEDYNSLRKQDKNTKTSSLNPGEKLGFATNWGFYYPENAKKCDDVLSGYRSELNSLLDEVKTEIKTKTAEPPTTEQANLLVALSVGKPEREELFNAMENNLNNYATFSALNRLAAENEMYFDIKSPIEDLKDLEYSLSGKINRLYTANAEQGLSPASIAFENFMTGNM